MSYYVWELTDQLKPRFDEPIAKSDTLNGAKTYARISATHGKSHKAVSKGATVHSEIVRIYRKGTGERLL